MRSLAEIAGYAQKAFTSDIKSVKTQVRYLPLIKQIKDAIDTRTRRHNPTDNIFKGLDHNFEYYPTIAPPKTVTLALQEILGPQINVEQIDNPEWQYANKITFPNERSISFYHGRIKSPEKNTNSHEQNHLIDTEGEISDNIVLLTTQCYVEARREATIRHGSRFFGIKRDPLSSKGEAILAQMPIKSYKKESGLFPGNSIYWDFVAGEPVRYEDLTEENAMIKYVVEDMVTTGNAILEKRSNGDAEEIVVFKAPVSQAQEPKRVLVKN